MRSPRLSPAQRYALELARDGADDVAMLVYQVRRCTLDALESRGYALESRGYALHGRSGKWRITAPGRAALSAGGAP